MYGLSYLVWTFFLGYCSVTEANVPTNLCKRFYFDGLTEKNPYLPLWGVYEMQNFTHQEYPVFKRSNGNAYFYMFKESKEIKIMTELEEGKHGQSFGLKAILKDFQEWDIRSYSEQYPFDSIIDQWFYSDPIRGGEYVSQTTLRPRCISEDVDYCSGATYEFTKTITLVTVDGKLLYLNTKGLHYYQQMSGVFVNQRPVYKRNGDDFNIYLCHQNGYWLITNDYNSSSGFAASEDGAMRPEFITGNWGVVNVDSGRFFVNDGLHIRCKGIQIETTCEMSNPCKNEGRCRQLAETEVACACNGNYTGQLCDIPIPKCQPTELPHSYWTLSDATIIARFCLASFYPQFIFSTCVPSGGDASVGVWQTPIQCGPPAVSNISTTYRYKSWDDDDDDRDRDRDLDHVQWLWPTVLTLILFSQLILPFIIYAILNCISTRSEKNAAKENESCNAGYTADDFPIENSLEDAVKSSQTDQGADSTGNNSQMEKPKKVKAFKVMGMGRYLSLVSFFSFWVWVIYVSVCRGSLCAQYGWVTIAPLIFGFIMAPVVYIYMLLESIFASEKQYVHNLGDAGSVSALVTQLKATQPYIILKVECYHYETRSRVVFYNDANGNLQSRTETYQERVVSHYDSEVFEFKWWKDASDESLKGVEKYRVTKIKLDLKVLFGDSETGQSWKRQFEALQDRNRDMDTYMDAYVDRDVPGFKKRLAAYVDASSKPWWIGPWFYWLASFLGVTWPYRWLFRWATGQTQFTVAKVIYINYPSCPEEELCSYNKDEEYCTKLKDRTKNDTIDIPV